MLSQGKDFIPVSTQGYVSLTVLLKHILVRIYAIKATLFYANVLEKHKEHPRNYIHDIGESF